MKYLDKKEVLYLHAMGLRGYGGRSGLRDPGGLESALAQPSMAVFGVELHATIFEKAAAYLFHISEGQPFFDGNKRTAWKAATVFLEINGVYVDLDEEKAADFVLRVADMNNSGVSTTAVKGSISSFLEENSRPGTAPLDPE